MERIKILKIFKRQFLQFPNSVNPNSCQCCGGIYRRGYFCLIQIPEIKKESSANNFVTSRGQRGPKRATGTYCTLHCAPYITLSSPRAKRASPKGERAKRARAVTVSQCPHSEVGQDFLLRRRVTLTETAVTRKRKVEKWIRRWQIDCNAKGYKHYVKKMRSQMDFRAKTQQ